MEAEFVVHSFSMKSKDKVRHPICQITTFSGKTGEDVVMWVECIKHQAAINGWSKATHMNYMYSSLEDCVAKWATHLDQDTILDPKLFGEALINMFTPKSSHHTVSEFLNCVQMCDENVSQFAAELKYLVKWAGI